VRRRRRLLRAALAGALVGALAAPAATAAPVHTGKAGIALIEEFEGYFPMIYRDPVGIPTQCFGATGVELLTLPPIATKAQCRQQLVRSLTARYEPAVRALRLGSQNRFDATVSFVYNVGVGGVSTSTGVGRALRARQWVPAANELLRWDKAGGRTFPGLTRRRHAERALFLTPDPIAFTAAERRMLHAKLTPAVRVELRRQAARIQQAARAVRGGWNQRDRKRRFPVLRARALTR
jgi:lysozyme